MWMTDAYPKIKLFCQNLGYEFQVVDMRWGVRNESVDEHNGTEMCLREVQQCQRLSTGPNFIVSFSLLIQNKIANETPSPQFYHMLAKNGISFQESGGDFLALTSFKFMKRIQFTVNKKT